MLVNDYIYRIDVNGDANVGGIYVKRDSLIEILKRQEEALSSFEGMIEETVLEEPKVSKLLGKTVAKTLIDTTGINISSLKSEVSDSVSDSDTLFFSATWDMVIKQKICSKCAYCKLCEKGEFRQFIDEEINNNFECGSSKYNLIYKEVEELYPTKELHEYIFDTMSDSNKELSNQEKYNFCKILIQAEYEKYKKREI